MKKIHLYSVLDIYSLITTLHCLKEKSELILIIDSLPALYLSSIGFYKNNGKLTTFHQFPIKFELYY